MSEEQRERYAELRVKQCEGEVLEMEEVVELLCLDALRRVVHE